MTQDITAIIDGGKRSVEAVGRSGHEYVYLDNVSFRIDASKLSIPHDSSLSAAKEWTAGLFEGLNIEEYDLDAGEIYIDFGEESDIISIQALPAERTANGPRVDLTVTLASTDVTNSLPQTVLNCEAFLHQFADTVDALPGRITFNIAYAYVQWDDVDQLVEWDDIEIPR